MIVKTKETKEAIDKFLKKLDSSLVTLELKNVKNQVLKQLVEHHNSQNDRLRTTVQPYKLNVYGVFLILRYSLNTIEISS